MGYNDDEFDSDSSYSSILSKMSGKKLAALAILIIIGAIFGFQALLGFPLKYTTYDFFVEVAMLKQ